jgi:hypothetical protein
MHQKGQKGSLLYKKNDNFTLVRYLDADFAGDIDDKTST